MHVVVTGSSGLVGSALIPELTAGGHIVRRLVRRFPADGDARWDPVAGVLGPGALDDADAVVHLAGEGIAAGRWSAAKKARIRDSRVRSTLLLARSMAALDRRPKVFVSASAVGFYGDRSDELVDEATGPGRGFLADVCKEWEAATRPASDAGVHVVNVRLGVVLSRRGGALPTLLRPFRVGAGGPIGTGRQYMSWIAIDDVVGAIEHLLRAETVTGPVNLVAPDAVTNGEFTKALGRVLRRPTVLPVPAFALRLLLGEMADEMLLASTRVRPSRLLESAYRFRHPRLEAALRHLLGKG
ncbi:MAG TPA: TIGR01777 family oxidoreductase [Methylomirabilota bacterium]|nr:TIGR01777 family oxidoreductase [Methylomirabilota bacterium]